MFELGIDKIAPNRKSVCCSNHQMVKKWTRGFEDRKIQCVLYKIFRSCVIQDFSSVPRKIVNASRKRQPSVPHTNRASEARNLRVELIWERVWFFVVQQMLKKNILVQWKYIQKKTLKMRLGLKAE